MAHFAKIGLNNKVTNVISIHDNVLKDADGVEQEVLGVQYLEGTTGWSLWKQTSYNANLRKNCLFKLNTMSVTLRKTQSISSGA